MASSTVQSSRGAALVLAMLIVAMVTAISVELTWRFDLGSTRSGNRWYGMQANSYLEGGEEVAKFVLRQDLEEGGETDSTEDVWAEEVVFDTPEGFLVGGRLEDAAGRFNLNLLLSAAPSNQVPAGNQRQQGRRQQNCDGQAESYTENQRRFIRLLQTIPIEEEVFLDQQSASNITEAVIDWMDADSNQFCFGGAESDYYSGLDIPYTIANKPMVSVSELRVIKGLNELPQSFFEGLYPLVIALPQASKININTASLQIFRTFNRADTLQPLSAEEGQLLFEGRGLDEDLAFDSVGAFVEDHVAPLLNLRGENIATQFDQEGLVVNSSYFIFSGEIQMDDQVRRRRSMLHRESAENIVILRRTNANF